MKKEKIQVILFAACFFGISVLCMAKPPRKISASERRKLAQRPEASAERIMDGRFMSDFEKYAVDQFPFRDGLRTAKAWISENIFMRKDQHGIYIEDGVAVKMEYPMNEKSIAHASERFRDIYDRYLKESGSHVYLAVVPDKNYYIAERSGHLSMDYDKFFERVRTENDFAESIDIAEMLDIDDYYATDVHWRQERLVDIARKISGTMGTTVSGQYELQKTEKPFYGVYCGQSGLPLDGEELIYLTNETLAECTVTNYENGTVGGIYDIEKAAGNDAYDIFLSGPVSLLTIENPMADNDRELLVFRDSFGSSLAPLLAEGYAKTTLVDIRYLPSVRLGSYIDFHGQDVLFLYSTTVLNNSETMK